MNIDHLQPLLVCPVAQIEGMWFPCRMICRELPTQPHQSKHLLAIWQAPLARLIAGSDLAESGTHHHIAKTRYCRTARLLERPVEVALEPRHDDVPAQVAGNVKLQTRCGQLDRFRKPIARLPRCGGAIDRPCLG